MHLGPVQSSLGVSFTSGAAGELNITPVTLHDSACILDIACVLHQL